MKDCCEVTADYTARQRRVLRVVLWINIVMFLVEATAGLLAHSTALFADSVDMLGDAIVYGFSLYVISRGLFWQARAALLKGVIMAAFGIGVLVQVGVKVARGLTPTVEVMGAVGALAFAANLLCWYSSGGGEVTTSTCGRPGSALGTTWSATRASSWPLPRWRLRGRLGLTL